MVLNLEVPPNIFICLDNVFHIHGTESNDTRFVSKTRAYVFQGGGARFYESNLNLLLQNRASLEIFFACQKSGGGGMAPPAPGGVCPKN